MESPALIDLVQRARSGDGGAVEALCDLLEPRLRRYVSGQMGPRARRWTESSDVVQQVLVESIRSFEFGSDEMTCEGLLARLQKRAVWRIRDVVRNFRFADGESAASETAAVVHEHGVVTVADERRWLLGLVDHLPDAYAEVVKLCAIESRSYAEAGELLGVGADTVRKRYERAKRALQRSVARRRGD